ncbi:PIN domain-containing protein [Fervidobacterium sp.]
MRLLALGLVVVPFTLEEARLAGELDPPTRALGLSLGDRACLATAARLGITALTTDRAWKAVPEARVEIIR